MGTEQKQEQELSPEEQAKFEKIVGMLKDCRQAYFYDVGKGLKVIHDEKLYRKKSTSWESFCEESLDMTRVHAERQMNAAIVVDILKENQANVPCGTPMDRSEITRTTVPILPRTESQARPLARLKNTPSKLCTCWQEIIDNADQTGDAITAFFVDRWVDQYLCTGKKTPADERREIVETDLARSCVSAKMVVGSSAKSIQEQINNNFADTSRAAIVFQLENLTRLVKRGEKCVDVVFDMYSSRRPTDKEVDKLFEIIQPEEKKGNKPKAHKSKPNKKQADRPSKVIDLENKRKR